MKIWFLTGLTCSGKTRFIRTISKNSKLPVNLINGDLLQSFKNFKIITNQKIDKIQEKNLETNLYGKFDLIKNEMNANM